MHIVADWRLVLTTPSRHISSCGIRARAGSLRVLSSHWIRTIVGSTALLAVVFGQCAGAMATSTTATLRVKVLPIPVDPAKPNGPSYPDTGDVLGEGAAFEGEVQIHGDEYGGFPPPVTGVSVLAPAGIELHPQGFAVCQQAVLESHEIAKCPKHSSLTSVGSVSGVVSFGGTRVHETLTLQAFF